MYIGLRYFTSVNKSLYNLWYRHIYNFIVGLHQAYEWVLSEYQQVYEWVYPTLPNVMLLIND